MVIIYFIDLYLSIVSGYLLLNAPFVCYDLTMFYEVCCIVLEQCFLYWSLYMLCQKLRNIAVQSKQSINKFYGSMPHWLSLNTDPPFTEVYFYRLKHWAQHQIAAVIQTSGVRNCDRNRKLGISLNRRWRHHKLRSLRSLSSIFIIK